MSTDAAQRKSWSTWEIIKTYYRFAGAQRRLIPLQLVMIFFDGMLQAFVPAMMGYVVDQLVKDTRGFVAHQLPILAPLALLGCVVFYICAYTQHYLMQKIGQSVGIRFQVELYQHLQLLSVDFYQRTQVGEITTRLTNDINQGVMPLYAQFTGTFWALSVLAVSLVTIACISLPLLGVFLLIVALMAVTTRFVSFRVKQLNREVRDEAGRINARITESIYANLLIRSFARELAFAESIREHSAVYLTKVLRTAKIATLFSDIMNTFVVLFAPLAILLAGALFVGGGLTVGALAAAFAYWKTASGPISGILNNITAIYTSLASLERVIEFFNERPSIKDLPHAQALQVPRGEITLRDVTFAYPNSDGAPVLDGLSVTVPPQTSLAIIGESGAGKSTVVQLLLRFYDPARGQVCIDGQNLRDVTQASLREHVGLVMQETILLSGSIRDNLLLAKPDATVPEMIAALKHAQAWDFVRDLPQGLNTLLGERGARLSGGQKQRLSIARVFLKNPPIVIFDEATSALDSITETQIQATMESLFARRTAVVIAHRLSTIVHCDRILLLDHGAVAAYGPHADLLATCPRYRELCAKQAVTA